MTWLQIHDALDHPAAGPLVENLTVRPRPLHEYMGPLCVPRELHSGEPRRTVWVVKKASGGDVRVLAERHRTIPRPDGTELRFYDGDETVGRRVASFPAGSWHSCVAESALEPKPGDQ
ncbi:hypothetical protein R3P82_12795 [Dietzia maris]|uniref:Uncharacterized protein n=1 Tax=Dietzia maris TaxID=37915 RepID=A0AAE4QZD7_9ACTN|nr:hypothetical protein [Dietzia maris]MDV6299988.1 hypothetical protein [Dietzia maris]